MTIATDFNDEVTGFNARAEALATAALAAYAAPTAENVAAVITERASLTAALIACLQDLTLLGAGQGGDGGTHWGGSVGEPYRVIDRFLESIKDAVAAASLNDVLPMKLAGRFLPSFENGLDAAALAASGVARVAAYESSFAGAAAP